MSQLLDFYRMQAPDSEGRTLAQIWEWSHEELEYHHDFIQWLFPLTEPSAFNPDAPLLTEEDRAAFKTEPRLQQGLRRSLAIFLNFLGLELTGDGHVVPGENFPRRLTIWKHSNHNWLRITRVLKSLRLLGLDNEARAFWRCLKDLHEKEGYGSESLAYWRSAAED